MCNCKAEIEERLLERFKEMKPEGSGHKVSLLGYAFIFSRNGGVSGIKPALPIECTAEMPIKKGGTKRQTFKESMIATYCPFCGVKFDEGKG